MFSLHKECLTRRYLLHLIQLLEGLLGFGLGRLGIFNSRRKLGCSRLRVKLQTLMFLHENLELLPHLANLSLIPLPLGALQVALFSGSSSACLRVATSDVAPAIAMSILSLFAIAPF